MAKYETLSLEKEMYNLPDKSFTQVLEELDPSDNYFQTPLEGLDAYQRQLKRFNIHITGQNSDNIEKFFQTKDSEVLFPEYIKREVNKGIQEDQILNNIVASTTQISSMDYRTIYNKSEDDVTKIDLQENLVHLNKHGRLLVASYEALRFQRIDLFSVVLRQIGRYLANAQIADAVSELIKDKPINKCVDFDDFYHSIKPYIMNTLLVSDIEPNINASQYIKTYNNYNVPKDCIIGFDKTCALEMVKSGDLQVDYNRIIDRQFEQSAIYQVTGFSVIFKDAINVIN